MRVVIFGSGGHGKVTWDILTLSGHEVVGFLDDQPPSSHVLGLPVVARPADLPPHDGMIIAVGDNQVRAAKFTEFRAAGTPFVNAIHPSAIIAGRVTLGVGVVIAAGVVINLDTTIGDNAILNTGATIDHDNRIGDHAHVAPGCHLAGTVTVSEGAFLGIGTSVVPGRRIGAWATVGAGSVIVRDVEDGARVAGVPARPLPLKAR
jgi:sugar O-acyltransferase (sialic acid O-acetyltransferase NeuD family)